MNKVLVIEESADRQCDCCKRVHRKLVLTDGYWMGKSCTEQYNIFKFNKNINTLVWRGWEKQYAKLCVMTGYTPKAA